MNEVGNKAACNKCIGIIPKYKYLWTVILRLLVLFINVCVLVSFNADTYKRFDAKLEIGELKLSPNGTTILFTVTGVVMGLLDLFLLLICFVS